MLINFYDVGYWVLSLLLSVFLSVIVIAFSITNLGVLASPSIEAEILLLGRNESIELLVSDGELGYLLTPSSIVYSYVKLLSVSRLIVLK